MTDRAGLVATMLVAIGATVAVTAALLVLDPAAPRGDALRTGGLTGGAVLALYALWLNDRRRRTDEARHELDTDRIADERFARAVELLGHDSATVRTGALHALAALPGTVLRYRQTVLDVLCATLRTPPDPAAAPGDLEVRRTAQRLLTDLLPWGNDPDPRRYHVDLTGAHLHDLRLAGRRIGRLVASRAHLTGTTTLTRLDATKPVLLDDVTLAGRLDLRDAVLAGGLSLRNTTVHGPVDLTGSRVTGFLDTRAAPPDEITGAFTTTGDTRTDDAAPPWIAARP